MFGGPNGSGKSTLKSVLPKELLGVYLNPDEIEQEIRKLGFLDLSTYGTTTTKQEALSFFSSSSFLISAGFTDAAKRLDFIDGRLSFTNTEVNSYTEGKELEMKTDRMPSWFKRSVWDKINPTIP